MHLNVSTSSHENQKEEDDDVSLYEDEKIKRSVDIAIGLLVCILNLIEIILILRLKRKRNFEVVLLSLCVADMFFGISKGIISVVYFLDVQIGEIFELSYLLFLFFVLVSIFHLLFIAVDTLYAIIQPILHNVFMTRKKIYFVLIAIYGL